MSVQFETKAAVTVAEMARMLGLSRARFYQLQQAGIFPALSMLCRITVQFMSKNAKSVSGSEAKRNCGVNGKPVLFYARNLSAPCQRCEGRNRRATMPNLSMP